MTTLFRIELTCPICGRGFESRAVLTAGRSARRRTDFHEPTAGVQPLPYLVHACPTCGYTGRRRDFEPGADVSPVLASRVWRELAPRVPRGPVVGSEKYEFAAKVAAWQDASPDWVGELLLRAAWCCVDEGDVEAERYFRREAAWRFELALAGWDTVAPEMRALLTYLVGELWRRVGDEGLAAAWFGRVRSEVVAPARQRWLVEAAARQRTDPLEWFDCERDGDRPMAALSRGVDQPVVVERGAPGGSGLRRWLQRVTAVTRRAARRVVAYLSAVDDAGTRPRARAQRQASALARHTK